MGTEASMGRSIYRKKIEFLVCSSKIWAQFCYLNTHYVVWDTTIFWDSLSEKASIVLDQWELSALQE